jgi:two-component system response regulator AtoC
MDPSERRHLLLLWRDPAFGAALARELREYGYSVHTAPDLPTAATLLLGQPIDLVLCEDADAHLTKLLPQLVGGATLIALAPGHLPLAQSQEAAREALQAGAYDYLPAPHRPAEIVLALTKAAAREAARPDPLLAGAAARFLPTTGASIDAGVKTTTAASAPSTQSLPPGMLVVSSSMGALLAKLRRVAAHTTTVLLTGESGTGKEVLARALHSYSPRRDGPFCAVNCGALPETLLESLLFGHRRGAFTDAVRDQRGLLVDADHGTLFLDEIAELSPQLQVKLLRVLMSHRDPENPSAPPYQLVQPLGAEAHEAVRVDVRIVAATLRDLEVEVAAGRFREDLYYRLSVVPLHVPPLRERKEDILPLAQLFLRRTALRLRRPLAGFTIAAQDHLLRQGWPGNVRQLENTIERAAVLADAGATVLDVSDLPTSLGPVVPGGGSASRGEGDVAQALGLADDDLSLKHAQVRLEVQLIRRALKRTRGNRSAAARLLELSPRALLYKLREYQLDGSESESHAAPGSAAAALTVDAPGGSRSRRPRRSRAEH